MPNWCQNKLIIRGKKAKLDEIHAKINTESFMSSFLPLPKDLEGTTSPSQKRNKTLIKKYGFDNWYDWQVANWGTKWDFEVDQAEAKRSLIYFFDSAWAPPDQGINKISELYPKLTFTLTYEESSMGLKGFITYQNGEILDSKEK